MFGDLFFGWATIGIGIFAAERLERLALEADLLVVLGVPDQVCAGPSGISAARLVDDRDVRCTLSIPQPARHRNGAKCGVRDQTL